MFQARSSALCIRYLVYSLLHLCVSVLTYFLGKETEPGVKVNAAVSQWRQGWNIPFSLTAQPMYLSHHAFSLVLPQEHICYHCRWNNKRLPCVRFFAFRTSFKNQAWLGVIQSCLSWLSCSHFSEISFWHYLEALKIHIPYDQ